jgi:hypothetical protein
VNGSFEFLGGFLVWLNVRALYRAKKFVGVALAPTAFFAAWGMWNLYFYPSLGQWLSLAGGLNLSLAEFVWVGQMVYYSRRAR